ncbi:hypothetical protein AOCH_003091 [Aspergillus ochraceoroseus]|uniref:DUF6603 domain-containing protein n=1 Tax=Aspergillus ochraceoroseus TaxID=138278 RepID=A0A0F8UGN5_9EURO|nr:hypothetical protein AOCH_003091 [Aspergillus ochraceoroseus]
MANEEWEVQSHHLNIDEGDAAVHLLIKHTTARRNTVSRIEKAVLIDGGRVEGQGHIKSMVNHLRHGGDYDNQLQYFDTIVITHWDGDHVGGINAYFREEITRVTLKYVEEEEIEDVDVLQRRIDRNLVPFTGAWNKSFTHIYAPYWNVEDSNTEKYKEVTAEPPGHWEFTELPNNVYQLRLRYTWGDKGDFWVPVGVLGTGKSLLGMDFFTHQRPYTNAHEAESPGTVSKRLRGASPVMFCVAVDMIVCAQKKVQDRKDHMEWDKKNLNNIQLKMAKHSQSMGFPKINDSKGHRAQGEVNPSSITGNTTGNNEASIGCMIIWPNNAGPRVTHCFFGDMGDEMEENILLWATEVTSDGVTRTPVKMDCIKLSHHGAKFSTPVLMLPAWKPENIIAPNGMNAHHNHVAWPTLALIHAWTFWRAKVTRDPNRNRLWCLNFPVYLARFLATDLSLEDMYSCAGSLDPLDPEHSDSKEWRSIIDTMWDKSGNKKTNRNILRKDWSELDKESRGRTLVQFLCEHWNEYNAILDGSYVVQRLGFPWSGNKQYMNQIVRVISVLQKSRGGNEVKYEVGEVRPGRLRGNQGRWKDDYSSLNDEAWVHAISYGDEWCKSEQGEEKQAADRMATTPLNSKTRSPSFSTRRAKRPLGGMFVPQAVGEGMLRDLQGMDSSTKLRAPNELVTVSTARFSTATRPVCLQDDQRSFITTTTVIVDGSDARCYKAKADSHLDLFLERLDTGALAFPGDLTVQEGGQLALDDSDEILQFMRACFPSAAGNNSTRATLSASMGGSQAEISAFTAQIHLPLTNSDSLMALTFGTQHNEATLQRKDATPPDWLVGKKSTAGVDCIGPAQMIVMGLGPAAAGAEPPVIQLQEITQLFDIDPENILNKFAGKSRFTLASDRGVRNALWLIPEATHTASLRLVFQPIANDPAAQFAESLLKEIQKYMKELSLPVPSVTSPRVIAKCKWIMNPLPPADDVEPLLTESELIFTIPIEFEIVEGGKNATGGRSLTLETAMVIRDTDRLLSISFGADAAGVSLGDLLAFLARAFKIETPEIGNLFPGVLLDMVRLLQVLVELNDLETIVTLEFQVQWASLTLKCMIQYTLTNGKFRFAGHLFNKNRPESLPGPFSFIPYMPNYERWTVTERLATTSALEDESTTANLNTLYQALTTSPEQRLVGEVNGLNPGPFEMELLCLTWSFEKPLICFEAQVVCPPMDPAKSKVPPIRFTAGRLNLRYDYEQPDFATRIQYFAIAATFTLTAPAAKKDGDKPPTARCGALVEYVERAWRLTGMLAGLTGDQLFSLFDPDCNQEMLNLLRHITLDLTLVYHYSSGVGSTFTADGRLRIGQLKFDYGYHHYGDRKWDFSGSICIGEQNTTLFSIAQSLFGINPQSLPSWVASIAIVSPLSEVQTMDGFDALEDKKKDFASFCIVQKDDYLVSLFRCKLTDNSTVAFYQVQKKRENPTALATTAPKRVLVLSVAGMPSIKDVPMVGTIHAPFDEMAFAWVLDGNEPSTGFTRAEMKVLWSCLADHPDFPPLHCHDNVKETTSDTQGKDKAGKTDQDVLLSPGFHFIISLESKVILDYVFGGPDSKPSSKDSQSGPQGEELVRATSTTPVNKKFGPLTVMGFGIDFDLPTRTLSLTIDGTLNLGPIGFTMLGFGVSLAFTENTTLRTLGGLKPTVVLRGLGASLSTDPLTLAGLLEHGKTAQGDYYQGAAAVGFAPYVFRASGYYGQHTHKKEKDTASGNLIACEVEEDFLLLTAEEVEEKYTAFLAYFSLDGPLFTIGYAEIRGLTGGFGYNTTITMPTIDKVLSFPFLNVPPTSDTKEAQGALMGSGWFGVREGSFWVAAGLTVLAFEILAVTEMPKGRSAKHKFACVQLALAATVDVNAGILTIDGQLTPASYVLDPKCHLTGGFALYSWFGSGVPALQGSWVFTVGGFHPQFKAPSQYPSPPRLGISWSFSEEISITGEAYFAMTPKVCMGGGRLHVTLSVGALSAYFDAYVDFLIQYRPFHFQTQGGLAVGVRYTLDLWLVSIPIAVDISSTLYLEGPPVAGRVHVDFWVFGFDIHFGAQGVRSQAFIDLEEFYQLVLQADSKPPALLLTANSKSDALPVPYLFSCTSGLIPTQEQSLTPTTRNAPWTVRGAIFAFSVSCKFPFDHAKVITESTGTSASVPLQQAEDISSRPMGLPDKMNSSCVTITISRLPTASDFDPQDDEPTWDKKTLSSSTSALPAALWSKYTPGEDLLNGASSSTVTLNTTVNLHAPGEKLSDDNIAKFSTEKTMGQSAAETPFPNSSAANKRWYPDCAAKTPAEQFKNVLGTWKHPELGPCAAQRALQSWATLLGRAASDLNAQPPCELMETLNQVYTEAPRMTLVV